jgi:hypothetical protein
MIQCRLGSATPQIIATKVVADMFVRKMNGGSQSSLVGASDGNFYVLKFAQNPQGLNTAFNEAFGSILAQHLGLPVPEWCPIEVSKGFIEENPWVCFESAERAYPPSPGLHFGSRFVIGTPEEEVYEIVPHGWMKRVRNPQFFAGMLLLDIWTQNLDRRQALFIERSNSRALDVVFFDHGHMFGKKTLKNAQACLYYHRNTYRRVLESGDLENWISRIEAVDETMLRTMMEGVPREWRSRVLVGDTIALLTRSQETVRQKVNEIAGTLVS